MVEETTAASHALARDTEELTRLIARFDLGRAGGAVGPARRDTGVPTRKAPRAPVTAMKVAGRGGAARKPEPDVADKGWQEF